MNPNQPSSSSRRGEETSEEEEEEEEEEERNDYWELLTAVERKDWEKIEDFVDRNPAALSDRLEAGSGGTLFHLMADFVEDKSLRLMDKFVGMASASALEITEEPTGWTPLFYAALAGNRKAAEILVRKNENLPNMKDPIDQYPIHMAAMSGSKETVEYLQSFTEEAAFTGDSGRNLVEWLIHFEVIDVAFNLLKHHPKLARENLSQRSDVLQTLARKPKLFESGCGFGRWKRFIYGIIDVRVKYPQSEKKDFEARESVAEDMEKAIHSSSTKRAFRGALIQKIPFMLWNPLICLACCFKKTCDTKLIHIQSVEIVRMMCGGVIWNSKTASLSLKHPILTAAKLGIYEIVNEIWNVYPSSSLFFDNEGKNVSMLAVLHRREKLFRILREKRIGKLDARTHPCRNNTLHLAAGLVRSNEVAGAALQMQRELQWFKVVENRYSPTLQEQINESGQTPAEMFREKHEVLVKEGETWMRDTARAYSVVVSLIITAVFAAAFNVPGGRKAEGPPVLLHDVPFIIFMVSDAFAFFSSTTSLLIFLRILTSRYAQEEFLESLPKKLMYGLISMFFSIVAMVVAFGATIYIVLSDLLKIWVITLVIAMLGCIPIISFAWQQIPFLLDLYFSTCRPSLFQPLKIRM